MKRQCFVFFGIVLVISLAGNLASASPQSGASHPKIIDLAGGFVSFFDNTIRLSDPERCKRFYVEIAEKAPDLYNEVLFAYWKNVLHIDRNIRLTKQLHEFPAIRKRYEEIYATLSKSMVDFLEGFHKRFPDFKTNGVDVYMVHSLGGSNGAAALVKNRILFYLGVDMMAIHNNYSNQEPFFDHELFHVYHLQKYKYGNRLYSQLWMEGLAVYVAKKMNPSATNAELMINDELIAKTNGILRGLAKDADKNLELPDEKGTLRFMYFNVESKDRFIPARAGYYLGYLLVSLVGKSATIEQMIIWQDQEVVLHLRSALKELISQSER